MRVIEQMVPSNFNLNLTFGLFLVATTRAGRRKSAIAYDVQQDDHRGRGRDWSRSITDYW